MHCVFFFLFCLHSMMQYRFTRVLAGRTRFSNDTRDRDSSLTRCPKIEGY